MQRLLTGDGRDEGIDLLRQYMELAWSRQELINEVCGYLYNNGKRYSWADDMMDEHILYMLEAVANEDVSMRDLTFKGAYGNMDPKRTVKTGGSWKDTLRKGILRR